MTITVHHKNKYLWLILTSTQFTNLYLNVNKHYMTLIDGMFVNEKYIIAFRDIKNTLKSIMRER